LFISNFRPVLNVVFFLLGDSSAPEFYVPTFLDTLFHLHRWCTHLWRWNSVPKCWHIKFRESPKRKNTTYLVVMDGVFFSIIMTHHNGMNQDEIKGKYSELHKLSDCKVRISAEHDSRRQQSSHLRNNTNRNALSKSSKFHHNTKLPKCPSRSALSLLREYYVLKAKRRA